MKQALSYIKLADRIFFESAQDEIVSELLGALNEAENDSNILRSVTDHRMPLPHFEHPMPGRLSDTGHANVRRSSMGCCRLA